MQRFGYLRSWLPAAGGVALALAAACGDGDNGSADVDGAVSPPPPDANVDIDATPQPDADEGPGNIRSGIVAFRDVTVTNPEAAENNRGGNVTIDFLDLEQTTYIDQIGASPPIGSCAVTTYGPDGRVNADEGPITISGTNVGDETGSFVCEYDEDVDAYRCVLAEGADTDMTLVYDASGDAPVVRLTLAATDLSGDNVVGGYVEASGFGDEALDGVLFPIIDQAYDDTENASTLFLRPQDFGGDEDAAATGGSFRVVYGIGDGHFAGNTRPFLVGSETGETTVTVSKPDGDVVEGFDVQADPVGDGMQLATGEGYILPHEFPLPPAGETEVTGSVKMSCGSDAGNGDGNCGIVPDDLASNIRAFIIDGRTTDAPLEGVPDHTIPLPVEEWAVFTCAFLGGDEGTLSEQAINAVLATDPTRIRLRAMHVNGHLLSNDDGDNSLNLLVGHELVGYTDWVKEEPAAQ